jgi:hypothetical protein
MLRLQDPTPGRGPPLSYIWIPRDGRGPMLMGMTPNKEFVEPPGYDRVTLIGTPQVTYSRGVETEHALDSMKAALELARYNRYSVIFFNSTLTTGTGGEIQSDLRPDVLAVVRPGIDVGYRFSPYESVSPGQVPEDRVEQLKGFRGLNILVWNRYYKKLMKLLGSMDISI